MTRTHYEVLGVSRSAGGDAVRRAYIGRARQFHPDRYVDAGTAQRAAAQRSMQEVNEAWRVLGDPGRRRRYDAELDPVMSVRARWESEDERFATRLDGTMPETVEVMDPASRVIRGLPWVVLIVVLLAIFVFTAYAVTGNPATDQPGGGGGSSACVTIGDGPTVQPASCGTPGARAVVAQVGVTQGCPLDSERLQPATGSVAYCLRVGP
ncbi:MAG TPA: J domain-containing protein [Acidimicrobiales bacterium]|jgi:DnaJ-domain-containing protein 1